MAPVLLPRLSDRLVPDVVALPPDLGPALKEALARSEFTYWTEVAAAADALGMRISAQTLRAWAAGRREPSPGTDLGPLEVTLHLIPGTLPLRLTGHRQDPEGYAVRKQFRPERLFCAPRKIRQEIEIIDGRVRSILTTEHMQVLFANVTFSFVAHAVGKSESSEVHAVEHCDAAYWWSPVPGIKQVRIGLEDPPAQAGERRWFSYLVTFDHTGDPDERPCAEDRRHRAGGAPTLDSLEIVATFDRPDYAVQWWHWAGRERQAFPDSPAYLARTGTVSRKWTRPRGITCGITWEEPA